MYPNKNDTIDILLDAARRAGEESSSSHPEDIAVAMMSALEFGHVVLLKSFDKFSN